MKVIIILSKAELSIIIIIIIENDFNVLYL